MSVFLSPSGLVLEAGRATTQPCDGTIAFGMQIKSISFSEGAGWPPASSEWRRRAKMCARRRPAAFHAACGMLSGPGADRRHRARHACMSAAVETATASTEAAPSLTKANLYSLQNSRDVDGVLYLMDVAEVAPPRAARRP